MLGMVLGVASLIVVLSVMNGFAGELRGRILSLVPHGFVEIPEDDATAWRDLAAQVETAPGVVAVSPYITEKAILGSSRLLYGAVVTAVDPSMQSAVSGLADAMVAGDLATLEGEGFNVVLGISLANMLGVVAGFALAHTRASRFLVALEKLVDVQ